MKGLKKFSAIIIIIGSIIIYSYCLAETLTQNRFESSGLKEEEVKSFFLAIQNAVKNDNYSKLSKLISYPIKLLNNHGHSVKILDEKDFVENFGSKFVDSKWKNIIVQQRVDNLFSNWRGVMIGSGEIWFSGLCSNKECSKYEIKIIGINQSARSEYNGKDSAAKPTDDVVIANTATDSEIYGKWIITGHEFAYISAMDDMEANLWKGKKAVYTEKLAVFDTESCPNPHYNVMPVKTDGYFQKEFNTLPSNLGIYAEQVTIIEIKCKKQAWNAPGSFVVRISDKKLMTLWDGVFFILTPDAEGK